MATVKLFQADVRMSSGGFANDEIWASDYWAAKELLEARYGAGNVNFVKEVMEGGEEVRMSNSGYRGRYERS